MSSGEGYRKICIFIDPLLYHSVVGIRVISILQNVPIVVGNSVLRNVNGLCVYFWILIYSVITFGPFGPMRVIFG